jgi:molybdate transport system regulatory protein
MRLDLDTDMPAPDAAQPGETLALHATLQLRCEGELAVDERAIRILESLRTQGSITRAAREVGVAYRTAWLTVERMRRFVPDPIVRTVAAGGWTSGSALTPRGERLIAQFRAAQRAIEAALEVAEGDRPSEPAASRSRTTPRPG